MPRAVSVYQPDFVVEQSSERFQKYHRLLESQDYQRVFKQEFRSADSNLLVLARARPGAQARLGLAISKKRIPAATDRNRLKRIVRESFRKHKNLLKGLDIVVVSHRTLNGFNNPDIFNSLNRHWKRLAKCAP